MKKPFDRVLIVMFENQYRSYVVQHPFMRKLAAAGADLTNSFGAFHPSQTNYIASLAGEVCAVTNDTLPASPLLQHTLVDLLEGQDVSWKAYMEAYPGEPWNPVWQTPSYPAGDHAERGKHVLGPGWAGGHTRGASGVAHHHRIIAL